jgi:hypothetical protein
MTEGSDSLKEIRTYKLSERFRLRAENKFGVRDKDAFLPSVSHKSMTSCH